MNKYRYIFISDLHLGTSSSNTAKFLEFLKKVEISDIKTIYLIGDIIDLIHLRKKIYWDKNHNTVIQKILRLARKGARVVYIPGNHDYYMRDFIGENFGGIEILNSDIHIGAGGKKYLITHGDEFDGYLRLYWFYGLGDIINRFILLIASLIHKIRRLFKMEYRSLSLYLNRKVYKAIGVLVNFDNLVIKKAKEVGVDGVITGHTHHAHYSMIGDIESINCGCWSDDHCSAVVEHEDGKMEIIWI